MKWRRPGVALVIAAVGLAAAASGASGHVAATKQRIAIEGKLVLATNKGSWTLLPLSPGPLKKDSGTLVGVGIFKPAIMRNGQKVTVIIGTDVMTGKSGKIVIKQRVESVQAGRGSLADTGTFTFHGKTGAYKGVTGGGGFAVARPANSPILYSRQEGMVTIP